MVTDEVYGYIEHATDRTRNETRDIHCHVPGARNANKIKDEISCLLDYLWAIQM